MNALGKACIQFYKRTDKLLLLVCLLCSAISAYLLFGIYSAGFVRMKVVTTQVVATFLGIICAGVVSYFDYRTLARLWKIYIPIACSLMVLTYVAGIQRFSYIDDRAWLEIPFIGVTFQPSEILKLAFIYSFALHLDKVKDSINNLRTVMLLCAHGGAATLMVMGQGDHGTAMVFVAICVCMMFGAGLSYLYIGAAMAVVAVASPFVWFFLLDDDKRSRIMTVFNPASDPTGTGWQQSLGLTAIGSGQVWGKGIMDSNHQYVPEVHNDFIFAFVGESGGFMGCCGLMLLISLLCLVLLLNSKRAADPLGSYICIGVFGMIAFQSIWGIGMCLSLLPVAGLTLPLFSAGGTSVLFTWVGIGMVLGVHRHSFAGLFDKH